MTQRRELVKRNTSQPEYLSFPTTIGTSPGVKISPQKAENPLRKSLDKTAFLGPGSYNPISQYTAPNYSMRKSTNIKNNASDVPGPGEYNADRSLDYLSPKLSKSISTSLVELQSGIPRDVPGPGTYNPKLWDRIIGGTKLMKQSVVPFKPKEKTFIAKNTETPMHHIKMDTFTRAEREPLSPTTNTPGPGSYIKVNTEWQNDSKLLVNKDSCTFGMRSGKLTTLNNNPGPGKYYDPLVPKGLYYSIGRSKREDLYQIPYCDNYYATKDRYPNYSSRFGTEKRDMEIQKSDYPGPGSYEIGRASSRERVSVLV